MFRSNSTAGIRPQLNNLLAHLEGVRDGSTQAVHKARVTIRRLREEFLLAAPRFDEDELARVQRRLKRAARALSRLRDADVGQQVLESITARVPPDSAAAKLRALLIDEREALWRRAIKRLDALDLNALPERVARARRRRLRRAIGIGRTSLRRHLSSRADNVRQAIAHAGGVYFPNRLHKARIAIKRLRYAVELADRAGGWRPPGALGRLKNAQEVLGAAHDRQMLLDRLAGLRAQPEEVDPTEVTPLEQLLRDEIHALHREYIGLREEILAICDVGSQPEPRTAKRLLLVAGVAVPSLALLRLGSTSPRTRQYPSLPSNAHELSQTAVLRTRTRS